MNMKIKKFRIKNYKSIIDSGDCYLNGDITILAGKNESGKTSILEALADFDFQNDIDETATPIQFPEEIPEISITFKVGKKTLGEIFKAIEFSKGVKTDVEIEIHKLAPSVYGLSHPSAFTLGIRDKEVIESLNKGITASHKILKKIVDKYPSLTAELFDLDLDNPNIIWSKIKKFDEETSINIAHITDDKDKAKYHEAVKVIREGAQEFLSFREVEEKFVKEFNEKWCPNFILFKSFEDVFPNKVPMAELDSNEWIKDLSLVSDLDVETVKSTADRDKHKHKKDINITLNKDYEKFWTQDISKLSIDWDSAHLFFWIEEDGYPYEPSLRSKGRQWHLAFYIKVSARSTEDIPNVILIDEPGLFLHAQALKDILGKLESSSKDAQIIFSTHSPYLLEADKLSRIRLIHRTKKEGTRVENKIHALADKETLTPILTAIGLELSSGITHVDKAHNIVVEGPSDLYYLEGFKKILKRPNLNFVFGGGSGNMPFVGTILHDWGCKVVYLYDNDKGKRDGEKNLKNNWLVSSDLVMSVIGSEGSIEDIFSSSDFKDLVLNKPSISYKEKNSEYVKKNSLDKVLLAKLFCDSSSKIKLSPDTEKNVIELFGKLEEKFKQ